MLTWVVYDISKDRTACGHAARKLLDMETDSVYVFPMCREDFEKVRIVGQGFDRELVADEVAMKII